MARSRTSLTIVLLFIVSFKVSFSQSGINTDRKCQTVKVKFCEKLPYNQTILPNTLNEDDQDQIALTLESQYLPLINYGCSDQMTPLLCFIYVPVCTVLDVPIPPCRRICTQAKSGCEKVMNDFGYKWPEVLNCTKFPVSGLCVGENYTSNPNATTASPSKFDDLYTVVPKLPNRKLPVSESPKSDINVDIPVFLIVSTYNNIFLFDAPTKDIINLHSGFDSYAILDFHYKYQWIFWAYKNDGRIHRGTLSRDVLEQTEMLIDVGPATVTSLAVDWVTDKLLWLESYPSRVRVSDLNGRSPTTIISEGLVKAKSMIIDPFVGCLFLITWDGDLYSRSMTIDKFDLRTRRHEILFNITEDLVQSIGRPAGMCSDLKNKRLYWADARSESIQSVDYQGKTFQVLIEGDKTLDEVGGLAIFGQYAFWVDRVSSVIYKSTTTKGGAIEVLKKLTASPPEDVKVFHHNAQPSGKAPYNITLIPSSAETIFNSRGLTFLKLFIINIVLHIMIRTSDS